MKKSEIVNMSDAPFKSKKKQLYSNKYTPHQSGSSSSNVSTSCSSSSQSSSSLSSVYESDNSSSSSLNSSSSVSTSSSSDESTSSSTTSASTTSSSTSNVTLSESAFTELDESVQKSLQSASDITTDYSLQKSTRDESVKDLKIVFKPLRLSRIGSSKQCRIEDSSSVSNRCCVYVDHLTKNVTVEHIREIFSKYGTIRKLDLPLDIFTKSSRGFSYIEYSTPEEALMAIKHMHGGQIDGYEIICSHIPYSTLHTSFMHHNG